MQLSRQDIQRQLSQNAYRRGLDYALDGSVVDVEVMADGLTLKGEVFGSGDKIYRQTIRFTPARDGRMIIQGRCTCPMTQDCKHVAAVLIEHFDLLDLDDPAPSAPRPLFTILPAASPAAAPALTHWLGALHGEAEEGTEEYPASIRKRLLYVLSAGGEGLPPLLVAAASVEILKNGSVKPAKAEQISALLSYNTPKFLRPSDRTILGRLRPSGMHHTPDAPDTLQQILATGRARWGAADGPVASLGPSQPAAVEWRLREEDASQHAALTLPPSCVAFSLACAWYADGQTGTVGQITTELPFRVLTKLLAAPSIPPEAVDSVCDALAAKLPGGAPLPRRLAVSRTVRAAPRPVLTLRPRVLQRDPLASWISAPYGEKLPVAHLHFAYDDVLVPAADPRRRFARGGALVDVVRDPAAEQAACAQLAGRGMGQLRSLFPQLPSTIPQDDLTVTDRTRDWLNFVVDDVPSLRAQGWEVVEDEGFPLRIATPDGGLQAGLVEGSGIDWFQFELGVRVGGEPVDLVPSLLGVIGNPATMERLRLNEPRPGEQLVVTLKDGRLLPLKLTEIRPILLTLMELFEGGGVTATDGRVRLARTSLAELAGIEQAGLAAGLVWRGGEALRNLGRMLRERGGIPQASVPAAFRAQLRPYQARGVDWLQFLRSAGLAGVLADEMGLGKTVQTLAHLTVEQAEGRLANPALVVCPTSLVANWRAEAAQFAPGLRVLVLHGTARKAQFSAIPDHDLVITTYPLLSRDHDVLARQEWHVAVLDEAQTIKNPASATAAFARQLRAGQRLCLSGTPMENHLGELWALFDFMMPGFLGARDDFTKRYRTPIEKGGDTARRDLLARRVAPFLLRRTKAEVAADLPEKTEIAETVEMGAQQRAVYEGIRLAMHARVQQAIAERGLARSGIVILDALLKMRQACCDPRLLKLATARKDAGSAKLDRLMEMLPPLLEQGRRVLIFSQFTSMLALIEKALTQARIEYALLTGQTKDRSAQTKAFQAGRKRVFLISLKAGGTGLNLTAADTVIHYDPWWNPAVEDQATGRAHRIGQNRPVFVHRLVTEGTIEAKMDELKARKQALVSGILHGAEGGALGMTEADLEVLFGRAA